MPAKRQSKRPREKLRRSRIRQLVRQFKENGMKMLLEHPANVQDLLRLADVPWLDEIDFGRLDYVKTTFVRRDYRHLESDVVLTVPLRGKGGIGRKLLIYILIEHQSEPDELMPLRLVDAQVQIFRYQLRTLSEPHSSRRRVRLSPVLPVVFYTGLRAWPQVGTLVDLVARGEEFRSTTPIVERPLFLNLPELPSEQLEVEGGYFGWLLRLLQRRRARLREFERLVERAVAHWEGMAAEERARWRDLLSFLGALIYHERREGEQDRLQECVQRSVESEELRQEFSVIGKTAADVLMERGRQDGWEKGRQEGRQEGRVEGRQQTLIRQLRRRFGELPANVVQVIEATADVDQLDTWLERVVTAETLEALEIPPTR